MYTVCKNDEIVFTNSNIEPCIAFMMKKLKEIHPHIFELLINDPLNYNNFLSCFYYDDENCFIINKVNTIAEEIEREFLDAPKISK